MSALRRGVRRVQQRLAALVHRLTHAVGRARGFYVGLDVLYQKLEMACTGTTMVATYNPGGARPAGSYLITDQEAYSVVFRAHRDIIL